MRTRLFTIIMVLAAIVIFLPISVTAQMPNGGFNRSILRPQPPQLDPELRLQVDKQLAAMRGPTKIVIELASVPTTETFVTAQAAGASAAQATAQAQRQLAAINAAQQTLERALTASAISARLIWSTQRVFNGFAVQVDASKIAQIRALPGVEEVYPLTEKRLDNAFSVPLIGAPELWDAAGLDIAGEGISIGIIDTGIDYLHTDFGGPGTEAAYEANDTTTTADRFFPTAKVVGGYDFAGDNYDASCSEEDEEAGECSPVPQPDPDPIDCNGHGTHVAGTAAGYGVNTDGSTYRGPYGPDADFDALRIGPGVAPAAELYALRVFGCEGSTDLTEEAIEWAVDPNGDGDFSDRLDVINMSLGSNFGSPFDSAAVASDNAAAVGVIVVASAGNSGDTFYITGSPAVSARTISVASSADRAMVMDGFRVNSPSEIAGIKPALFSINYAWGDSPPVTGDVVYPPTQRSGCEAFSEANQALLAGKIALLDWTKIGEAHECGSAARVNNAADAGAIGVIMVYPEQIIDIAIAGSARIPAVITQPSIGDQLKAHVDEGVNVTLSEEFGKTQTVIIPELEDTLSGFSSRGPRRVDSALKPDITAPGQTIFSAQALTGNEGVSFNGTSMAAPHVAGSMALLRQLHPDWSVEELKALAMNTANNDIRSALATDSPIYGPARIGAGRITLPDAATNQVVAYNADNPELVSVSFGDVEVLGTARMVKKIRVLNKSDRTITYNVTYDGRVDGPGVEYTLSASTVTLTPYGASDVFVTMTADASEMQHTHDPTIREQQGTLPRHWLSEESGLVLMQPSSGPTLRVPVYAAARPASDMQAGSNTLMVGDEAGVEGAIGLRGQGVQTGENFPEDYVSIVTAFELQHSSPNDRRTPRETDHADLFYVGVSTDLRSTQTETNPNGSVEESMIYFGIATHGDWSTPSEVEFDIYIDTNKDGVDDYAVFNFNYGSATGPDASDVFITVLVNLETGEPLLQDFLNGVPASVLNTAPFNTNVMVLPVSAEDLGLTNAASSFNYRVVSFSRDLELQDEEIDPEDPDQDFADRTPLDAPLSYDVLRPGIDLSGGVEGVPAYPDLDGEEIPFTYDRAAFFANRSQGVLLLHHFNTEGRRAEAVRVQGNFALYAPIILNGAQPAP